MKVGTILKVFLAEIGKVLKNRCAVEGTGERRGGTILGGHPTKA